MVVASKDNRSRLLVRTVAKKIPSHLNPAVIVRYFVVIVSANSETIDNLTIIKATKPATSVAFKQTGTGFLFSEYYGSTAAAVAD